MLIKASLYLPFPRPLVYATYRDKLLELVPQMHNVKGVTLKSRQEQNGTVQQAFEWHGKSDIPAMFKAFLSEDLLTWTDFATWKEAEYTTDWQLQPHAFREAVTWNGRDRYLEEGSGTRVETQGQLVIDPHRLKGVPGFLSGQVGHVAQEILAKQAEPNFVEMGKCVRAYLEKHHQ
jgi:hypothetical protein